MNWLEKMQTNVIKTDNTEIVELLNLEKEMAKYRIKVSQYIMQWNIKEEIINETSSETEEVNLN